MGETEETQTKEQALLCTPAWIVYPKNEDERKNAGGFMIVSYSVISGIDGLYRGQRFTAKGYYLPVATNAQVILHGKWGSSKRGPVFEVETAEETIIKNEKCIKSFLLSSISGISYPLICRIWDTFKAEAIEVLEKHMERLLTVKGIDQAKFMQIRNSYLGSNKEIRELTSFLAPFSISPKRTRAIFAHIGGLNVRMVKNNPYILMDYGDVGFSKCDAIANAIGYPLHNEHRVEAGIKQAMLILEANGDCGIEEQKLLKKARMIVGEADVSEKEVKASLFSLYKANRIYKFGGCLYRRELYDVESNIATNALRLLKNPAKKIPDLEDKLLNWEKETGVSLDPIQRKAVIGALNNGIFVLTGGPGRGKTTVARAIVELRKQYGDRGTITLLAPTGRAARRLGESTGEEARTVDSRLKIFDSNAYSYAERDRISTEQIIVDESSMLDTIKTEILLSQVENGCNVTIVGDPDQLPSVGSGAVLRDLIASGVIPTVALEKVYRQAEGSSIIENAEKVNSGDTTIRVNKTDFCFDPVVSSQAAADHMINLYHEKVKIYGWENVALLSPFRKADSPTSTNNLNKRLQELINPDRPGVIGIDTGYKVFREGDVVMQIRNEDGISNGDIGRITSIDKSTEGYAVCVQYQQGEYIYTPETIDLIDLAYAISIHKSQGSEYKCIIMCLMEEHKIMLKRNLLYTGITRASKEVHIVGQASAVKTAILSKDTENRKTLLALKLQQLKKKQVA